MTEAEEMRKYAEAHGCGGRKHYVRPLPCVRDEHGRIKEQPLKRLVAKIDEELNELKQAIIRYQSFDLPCVVLCKNSTIGKEIAEEAADVKTAITTLEEAFGIDEAMRDEAIRQVNQKNFSRGRL